MYAVILATRRLFTEPRIMVQAGPKVLTRYREEGGVKEKFEGEWIDPDANWRTIALAIDVSAIIVGVWVIVRKP